MKTSLARSLLFAALGAVALVAGARSGRAESDEGHHRKPPPAAFDACKGKKADDVCEVTFHEHKMNGKCAASPDGLVCRPEHMGPPAQLVAACENKKEGEACKATMGERSMEGTCQKGRHGDQLICRR